MQAAARSCRVAILLAVLACAGCGGDGSDAGPQAPAAAQAVVDGGIPIRSAQVIGELHLPAAASPAPAVLVIGGSEGGLASSARLARRLAEAGFAALAVGYFGMEGLPPQLVNIPLETFDAALEWLAADARVDGRRLAVLGVSKGAEAALLVAAGRSELAAVVAGTPSSVAWQGIDWVAWSDQPSWTRAGAPVPYVRYELGGGTYSLVAMYARSLERAANAEAARIPVERIAAPLLLVCGGQDQLWPACPMAESIVARRRATGLPVQLLAYPEAGHAVFGPPWPEGADRAAIEAAGGSFAANAAARREGWPQVLAFLAAAFAAAGRAR